jgi:hypothetical protein
MTTNLSGRRVQAARNDGAILAAARDVFLEDPKAPIAAVAERAGECATRGEIYSRLTWSQNRNALIPSVSLNP